MSTDSHPAAGSPAWRSSRGLARDPWRVGGRRRLPNFRPCRAEHAMFFTLWCVSLGSSPCVPGSSFVHVQLPQLRRSIPAHAGRTRATHN